MHTALGPRWYSRTGFAVDRALAAAYTRSKTHRMRTDQGLFSPRLGRVFVSEAACLAAARPSNGVGSRRRGCRGSLFADAVMSIKFRCTRPSCRKALSAADTQVGRKTACPKCGQAVRVPAPPRLQDIAGDDPNACLLRASAHADAGQPEAAIEECLKALEADPDHSDGHYNLGAIHAEYGNVSEALREYRRALDLRPDHREARFNLAVLHMSQGDRREAIRELGHILEERPEDVDAGVNLAICYVQDGRIGEAIAQLEPLVKREPKDTEARNALGAAYVSQRRLDEAIAQFEAVVRLNPHDPEGHYNLGLCLLAARNGKPPSP